MARRDVTPPPTSEGIRGRHASWESATIALRECAKPGYTGSPRWRHLKKKAGNPVTCNGFFIVLLDLRLTARRRTDPWRSVRGAR